MTMDATASSTVPEIFDHLVAGGTVPALRRVSGVCEFDIDDSGQWFLHLDHGVPTLQEATDHPDCLIHCSASDFVEIAEGSRNLFTTYLQGRITVAGDITLALDTRRLLTVAA